MKSFSKVLIFALSYVICACNYSTKDSSIISNSADSQDSFPRETRINDLTLKEYKGWIDSPSYNPYQFKISINQHDSTYYLMDERMIQEPFTLGKTMALLNEKSYETCNNDFISVTIQLKPTLEHSYSFNEELLEVELINYYFDEKGDAILDEPFIYDDGRAPKFHIIKEDISYFDNGFEFLINPFDETLENAAFTLICLKINYKISIKGTYENSGLLGHYNEIIPKDGYISGAWGSINYFCFPIKLN